MPTLHFHSGRPPGPLADLPPDLKRFLVVGFTTLGKLSPASQQEFIGFAAKSLEAGYGLSPSGLASKHDLQEQEVAAGLTAATVTLLAFSQSDIIVDDFIEEAISAKLITEDARESVRTLAKRVEADRGAMKAVLQRSKIARELLPSLTDFETTIDVRLGFEKGRINATVPVVLAHIDTDSQNEEIWFQMTKAQVEKTIADLQDLLRRLEEAEKLAPREG